MVDSVYICIVGFSGKYILGISLKNYPKNNYIYLYSLSKSPNLNAFVTSQD